MPLDATFMDESKYLSPEQYGEIIRELCDFGLEEVRLTGGEPLLRKSFTEIADIMGKLPLRKIGLTTNGILLDKHFETLKRNRIQHLNISLDSLNEETFRKITFGNHLKRVLENIRTAKKEGFEVKVNAVAMRGVNEQEVFRFAEFAREMDVEVRFLELMRIGYACGNQEDQFISARELTALLKTRHVLTPVSKEKDSTSFNYRLETGAEIGFIASESQAFCGNCSRWRLSADGILRACLMKDDGLSIRNTDKTQREQTYQSLLGMKPFLRPVEVTHHMNAIGG